jgi:hypothetical protein
VTQIVEEGMVSGIHRKVMEVSSPASQNRRIAQ